MTLKELFSSPPETTIRVQWSDLVKSEILHQMKRARGAGKNPVRVYLNTRDYRALQADSSFAAVSSCWPPRFMGLELVCDDFFETPKVACGMTVR